MTTMPTAVAVLGWLSSAALAVVLARGRRAALAQAAHLARVAHELRGPLHAAGLVLHSVRRHTQDEAAIRALTALEVELGRVALATGDLQAGGGGGGGGAPPRESCDLAALVRDLAAGWAALADAQGRRLHVSVPPGSAALPVQGARLRVAQALGNLVDNALEHGAGDVRVTIRPGGPGPVQVEVCDDGSGLPAPVSALVARPRAANASRGHGLGIAAGIATDAGGRLAAAPATAGARLVLSLPAAHPAGVAVPTEVPQHPADPTRPLAS